jgi:2,4-dienoyl-CoA reductase-like NADH-dependent reductase (Old Yellow Enzyme family)
MKFTHVLQPIRINKLEIKNRIFRAGHGTYYGRGSVSDSLIAYHEARAKAGVGLTTLEVTVVHPSSASNVTLYGWDDSIIPGFRRISAMAHTHGMRLFTQLWHGGHHWPPLDGSPPWSASDVPSPWGPVPVAMNQERIDIIVQSFADAASRAQEGGLDGVELHFGHGYLVNQFFSPSTNIRTDRYGGTLDNRMRFGREILQAVRQRVGSDFAVGVRISDQHVPGGLTVEDAAAIVADYCRDGLLDFVNASMGSYHDVPSMLPAMETPVGSMLPSSAPIARAATVVRMVAGRYQTLEEADQLIREGTADMVAIVRGMIADAELMSKTLAGRAEDVRPCIGCNQGCVGGILGPAQRIQCTVNPAVGLEATLGEDLIVRAASPKKVVVVGGGPAGMEAARVAALCGHKVVLFEASDRLGGALSIAARLPKLRPIADIALWLERQIYANGVDVRLSSYAEATEVLAENPDLVIVACGSMPRDDGCLAANPGVPIQGMAQSHVHNAWTILDVPRERLGSRIVVYDDVGHYEAIGVAEYLIENHVAVTFVTRHSGFAPAMERAVRSEPALRRLREGNFTLHVRARVDAIGTDITRVSWLEGGKPWDVAADRVVVITSNRSLCMLHDELRAHRGSGNRFEVRLAGDAEAPRDLQSAISSAHMTARFAFG